jgi:dTDP-4-amino-4,6-dideoxygalactose transaminase
MKVKFLDLKSQYLSIKNEIDESIKHIIENSSFIGGQSVSDFEEDFAKYSNAKYCIAVANGTDALEIAIESLSLPKNTQIIVPANSFIASSEAVTRSGYDVIFCKYDKHTNTIDVKDLSEKITNKTSAVIAVHLYGHPSHMKEIQKITKSKGIKIIEDCAQAHGSLYEGKKVGSIGDVGCFSFYPGKNLGAYGDAGCIVTNSSDVAEKSRLISNHGRFEKYNHLIEGRNSRMDALQASVLSVKLKYLDGWIERRREVAGSYNEYFKNNLNQIITPAEASWAKHVYHLYVIKTNQRDDLKKYLESNKIECGIHYPYSLPSLKAYKGHKQYNMLGDFDESSKLLSLPIGEHIKDEHIEYVLNKIQTFDFKES